MLRPVRVCEHHKARRIRHIVAQTAVPCSGTTHGLLAVETGSGHPFGTKCTEVGCAQEQKHSDSQSLNERIVLCDRSQGSFQGARHLRACHQGRRCCLRGRLRRSRRGHSGSRTGFLGGDKGLDDVVLRLRSCGPWCRRTLGNLGDAWCYGRWLSRLTGRRHHGGWNGLCWSRNIWDWGYRVCAGLRLRLYGNGICERRKNHLGEGRFRCRALGVRRARNWVGLRSQCRVGTQEAQGSDQQSQPCGSNTPDSGAQRSPCSSDLARFAAPNWTDH